jgi:hypothetical protein
VVFWAKSATNSAITAAVINASNFSLYASKTYQLTNTWMRYNFTFKATANATGSFNIDMGGHTGTYHFDDFQLNIPAVDNGNQLKNADFSAGDSSWIFKSYYPAEAQGSVEEGEYAVAITNGGVYPWDIHIGQIGVTIEKDYEYTVSFDAYASAEREISAIVGKNSDPWTVYSGDQNISLSTNRKTYAFSFTMKEPTDNQARLGFDVGVSADDVFIDNVFLSEGTPTVDISEENEYAPRSFRLFQNWPNPFNPSTTIKFDLPKAGFVSVTIFDINGRVVETLLEKDLAAGIHELNWDSSKRASGVYFCKLSANGKSQIIKMILMR